MDKRQFALLTTVLFCHARISYAGWQSSPVSPAIILFYLFFSIFVLLLLRKYVIKKHLSEPAIFKGSIIIALLFSPLIFDFCFIGGCTELLIPSLIVLPFTLLMLVSGENVSNILHNLVTIIVTFLGTFSFISITNRQYHLFPGKRIKWKIAINDFGKNYKKETIIITIIAVVFILSQVTGKHFLSRRYLPISHDNMISDTQVKVPWQQRILLSIDINCHKTDRETYFLTAEKYDRTLLECIVIPLLQSESDLDFEFEESRLTLRDIESADVEYTSKFLDIYTYTRWYQNAASLPKKDSHPYCHGYVTRFQFATPPRQIELILPPVRINDDTYDLPPLRFEYHTALKAWGNK